ncbi:stip-1 [Pristionchus pacificus]|uniref:Stip-1 n=2 Tax=Pristionchus pacificus TaxID=54126 RepID=A0A2A6B9H3_PRIPA|nr:stip-1 [Pristionchus pacificus]|eukprot:PDM62518.1 stip-1 [Pristionchus pacificus]
MDDEDGMESFSIDDRDIEYALNPRRNFQSKEQATYGVWAADSDEEEENTSSRSRYDRKGDRRKPDYSKGVSFVSGGIKQGSSLVKEGKEEEEDEEKEFKFTRPTFTTAPAPKRSKQAGGNVFAGMRVNSTSATGGMNMDPKIMKMMQKQGYQPGKGLGKEGQGIIEPVQAAVRPGRGAVGAYGKEVTGPKFGESAADAQRRAAEEAGGGMTAADDDSKPAMPKGAWKKNARVKVAYRTMDDIMADEGNIGMRAAKRSGEKVIDMTGPEQRVYTGYEALSMKSVRGDAADNHRKFDIPELSHNLNLIIDLTEENIRKNNHRSRNLENSSAALRYDLKIAKEELEKEEEDLDRMKKVYELLESLQDPSTSMDDFKTAFRRLRSEFTNEYTLLELEKVAVPCILPQIKELFARWQPLQRDQVAVHLDLMEEWKEILEPPSLANSLFKANTSRGGGLVDDKLAAFDRLMWDGWMPPVRSAILRWDPRDDIESMKHLVETWLPVMPSWMRDKFIEQLLVPRITTRVEEWDPLTDPKPIHQWLVPWKDVVGDRLLPVFAPIRQKLAKALKKWTSTDDSALLILSPWRDVWTPATMSAFVQQNIVPKLREGLIQMNLDPSRNAIYKEFTVCVSWMIPDGLISPDVIANLLVETFFPRWYETLCFWLDSPSVVRTEVQTWMREWTARFPPILMAFPAIKECLRRGMLAALGQRPAGPAPVVPPPTPLLAPAPPPPPAPRGAPETQLSVKDALELMAARQGFTYIPQPGRTKDGKQVYWFGTQSIYVDRGIVFVMDMTTVEWRPIAVHELMSIA